MLYVVCCILSVVCVCLVGQSGGVSGGCGQ